MVPSLEVVQPPKWWLWVSTDCLGSDHPASLISASVPSLDLPMRLWLSLAEKGFVGKLGKEELPKCTGNAGHAQG